MPFCPSCGAQGEGSFCPSCGKPMGASGNAPASPASATGGLQDNVAGALCYALGLITGVLFLVLEPYNKNKTIRFHAFQSIFVHLSLIVFWVGVTVMAGVLGAISNVLALVLIPLYGLVGLGCFALWIFMLFQTFNGSKVVLPVIGPLAEQQAG